MIDPVGEARLTQWMLEHLSVTVVPIGEKRLVPIIYNDVLPRLDPPLNTTRMRPGPARTRLRRLRAEHLGVVGAARELELQLAVIRTAESIDPGVVVPISRARGRGSRRSRTVFRRTGPPLGGEGSA